MTSTEANILVVDDDPDILKGLSEFLTGQGLKVEVASRGWEVDEKVARTRFDLVVLDVMLPDENGLSICRRLSGTNDLPVILLTALAEETDRIIGLEIGAEDYVCKPFSPRELLARIRVILRRVQKKQDNETARPTKYAQFSGWCLDMRARSLKSPNGAHVELTTGEYELLQAFVTNPNEVMDRDRLLNLARGRISYAIDRTIDVQVMRLRRKLEVNPQQPQMIKTIRNGGYVFTPEVTNSDDC